MYPIKFNTIFKQRIWGGENIIKKLKKQPLTDDSLIGESWDICDRDDDQSVVINGYLKGLSIKVLREKYGKSIFGNKLDPNKPFPILVKILDAKQNLSLQIHPKKVDLSKLSDNAQSKTEFWYILCHEKDAIIMAGLNKISYDNDQSFKDDFIKNLFSDKLLNFVNIKKTNTNQLIYVESGIIHSIGAGNLILEIQENSDTTYRVSDWGRVDRHGNSRDLHINESLICIDFNKDNQPDIKDIDIKNNYKVLDSEYFESYNYHINKELTFKTDSEVCALLSVTNGEVSINSNLEVIAKKGDTVLLPANLTFKIRSNTNNLCSILITKPKI